MKYALIALLLSTAATNGLAQAGPAAPERTDIVVPELILRVEELQVQRITAPLPNEGELALGRVAIALPAPGELVFDDSAFVIDAPGRTPIAPGSSVFSTGRLGAGSSNHIVGELTLFKLGADPRFRLGFGYEGIDGYQFRSAGTGFFRTTNRVDGSIAAATDTTRFDANGSFTDRADGLQGVTDYFSVGVRRTQVDATLEYRPDPLIAITSSIDGTLSTRIQSTSESSEVPREREYSLLPDIEARISVAAVDIVFGTSYFLRFFPDGSLPFAHDVDASAGIDLDLPIVQASVRGGVRWDFATRIAYPWSARLGVLIADRVDASVFGGLRVDRTRYADLWAEVPLLAVGGQNGELRRNQEWFGGASARWSGPSGLAVSTEVEYTWSDARIEVAGLNEQSVYSFEQRPLSSLRVSSRAGWRVSPTFSIQTGWTGRFIDTVAGVPSGAIDGALAWSDPSGRFGLSGEVSSGFYPEPTLPRVGLTGSYVIADGVEIDLELLDLLAPLLGERGRAAFGPMVGDRFPFIEPGLRGSLITRISL